MLKSGMLASVLLLQPEPALAVEKYICRATAMGGVQYDATKDSWVGTAFSLSDDRIVLNRPSPSSSRFGKVAFDVTEEGYPFDAGSCKEDSNEWGFIFCDLFDGEFRMNVDTLRFARSYMWGYVDSGDDEDMPQSSAVLIGKCQAF